MSYQFDHRFLAGEMELYFFEESVGAGLPMWLPNGCVIRDQLEKFIKDKKFLAGYQRVSSPHLAKAELYERSAHLQFYKEDMYPPIKMDNFDYYLRPMNCPHHHKIFSSSHRSFRDLPLRLAEYGQVCRNEASGALRGISRVRGLCQNDAHIYVRPEDSLREIISVLKLHEDCYEDLGLEGYRYRLSLHDPKASDYLGEKNQWQECEEILRSALVELKLDFYEAIGEAAFYGPKIDVQMKFFNEDSIREESMGSIQLDFVSGQSDRFNLNFICEDGKRSHPWVIHRAPLGSHERFIAMLLEYYDGKLPRFLCPIELMIFPLNEAALVRSEEISVELMKKGFRIKVDQKLGSSLSKRILMARKLRPFASLVIGDKELSSSQYLVELRSGKKVELANF